MDILCVAVFPSSFVAAVVSLLALLYCELSYFLSIYIVIRVIPCAGVPHIKADEGLRKSNLFSTRHRYYGARKVCFGANE